MTRPSDDRTTKHAAYDDAVAVVRTLRDAGHVAYFAGGCVRDTLLGLAPKDYDVATDAPPDRVRKLFRNTQAVGAAFGVILVRQGKSVIEVATFRTDGTYLDGRRPEAVVFTTAEEDAKRRDFTINGLFMDPLDGDKVIDYVGGLEDLKSETLRAIGEPNHRFEEDHLRLLRAVRFAARFNLQIEPATAAAIRAHAKHLPRISPERIADELRRMLTPSTRVNAWPMLWSFRLVHQVMRFFSGVQDHELNTEVSVFLKIPSNQEIPFALAMAAAVVDFPWQGWTSDTPDEADMFAVVSSDGRSAERALRKALRLSNDELDDLRDTIDGAVGLVTGFRTRTVATIKRFLARSTASLSIVLLEAIAAVPGNHDDAVRDALSALLPYKGTDVAPPPLITGDDLTELGWSPGPVFKRVLDAVYDAQLEDRVADKKAAIQLAESLRQSSM
jgi:poly(A) polymerase